MREKGYYRYATVHGDSIIFACEDDLWHVSNKGGLARRLTTGKGEFFLPRVSPDGSTIAFSGQEEGHQEIYSMPFDGGAPKRLTYLGGTMACTLGWSKDSSEIFFSSEAKSPYVKEAEAFSISAAGGESKQLNLGHVATLSKSSDNRLVIGRNNTDPARWKRYRGGTAGDIWVEEKKGGMFKRLLNLAGNLVWPMWIKDRIYFLSDHEGVGNIYSVNGDGGELKRHTSHVEYYVRYPSTDGERIAYTAGGEIYVLHPQTGENQKIEVRVPQATHQIARRFVDAKDNIEHLSVHPEGHSLSLIVRGQPVTMPFWEDAPIQHGAGSNVRNRSAEWLNDGKRFVVLSDADGEERLEIHHADRLKDPEVLSGLDIGRPIEMIVHPHEDQLAIANHRQELLHVDLKSKKLKVLDQSKAERITGVSFSPDGRWLAYSWSDNPQTSIIRICDLKSGKVRDVTTAIRMDVSPCFDPDGKYLYFLSNRDFYPIYDDMQFALGFYKSVRPFIVTLRKDVPSPLIAKPKSVGQTDKKDEHDKKANQKVQVEIDFDGIQGRIIGLPVDEGKYRQLFAVKDRMIFTDYPIKGIRPTFTWLDEPEDNGKLIAYDFNEQRAATLATEVGVVSQRSFSTLAVYKSKKQLRVIDLSAALADEGQEPKAPTGKGRKSGWIDIDRVKVMIEPRKEWRQMFEESWRLQSHHFWTSDMSKVDWKLVHDRYERLVDLLRSRSELSDLIWEMQGELGTSHAYEMGGDHRRPQMYAIGGLGADLEWEPKARGYQVAKIIRGDSWQEGFDSPLAEPGVGVEVGDLVFAVSGVPVTEHLTVQELMMNQAEKRVALTVGKGKSERRIVYVNNLANERLLRYREWVETNRKIVHDKSGGALGYVHIPDMGPWGYSEFHRSYLPESNRKGLIVDARYNRGGHVSPLLLERLRRKRVGYGISRWGAVEAYPPESVLGPMVCITNQFAGSDGDIFSHCFKMYKLGPLVGKRTWGGVIGISPRHKLVDGTITTQPEYSFWFSDVGWNVENYGTDPDYDVDIAPHDFRDGKDPQMAKALELAMHELKRSLPDMPDFSMRPSLPLPKELAQKKIVSGTRS